jgi:hypothetical protein
VSDYLPYLGKQAHYQTKMVEIGFFGTPYGSENGWKQLQHTFLDQPNTFHELCSKTLSPQEITSQDQDFTSLSLPGRRKKENCGKSCTPTSYYLAFMLYPNLTEIEIANICFEAIMKSSFKFQNINYRKARLYIATCMNKTDQRTSPLQCSRCDPVGNNVTWPRITLQKTH